MNLSGTCAPAQVWALPWPAMLALAAMLGLLSRGADAAGGPSTRPAAQLRTWLGELASDEPRVRSAAVDALLALNRADLPTLAKVVGESRPLRPSQLTVLREVVTHVYISGIAYTPDPANLPFLGLTWDPQEIDDPAEPRGVTVTRRVPGFSAYQMLRDGDVIMSIDELPGVRLSTATLASAIKSFQPGQNVTLNILRAGKPLRVRVLLRARPLGTDSVELLDGWFQEHLRAADEYWDRLFRPAIGEEIS